MQIPEAPHRRYNPLLDEWVLCSPQRLERPWQGQVETVRRPDDLPYDPGCYLCPGNHRARGARNPAYTSTFTFDNDFPALVPGDPGPAVEEGLLVARGEAGRCRVLCFTPRHDLSLARMGASEIRPVVDAWAHEVETLGAHPDIRYVQVFENKGALMGCSNPHPHCQVWATGHVPTLPSRKDATQRAHLARHGRDLVGDYLQQELRDGRRVVLESDHWVALVPFWAVWPFETMLVPRRRAADLPALDASERDGLAGLLKRLTVRYDNLFRCSFPYSMGWHGRPTDGEDHPHWRLHAVFLPPLLRSASVKKFLVGYEMTGEPQRDLTPEEAALRLRDAPERHYLEDEA
jgi:UDPglucose--hexose-1-phosphate uridylyltransferase